jgi:hypothetical protein
MLTELIDGPYKIEHYPNALDCYDLLKDNAIKYWRTNNKCSKTNYDFDSISENSIRYLLETNRFNLGYTVVYDHGIPMAFGGIRVMDQNTTIVGARTFCFYTRKLLVNKILIPFQLDYSKKQGFTNSLVSFNEYNKKIYDLWQKFSDSPELWSVPFNVEHKNFIMMGKQTINKTEQYTIKWIL